MRTLVVEDDARQREAAQSAIVALGIEVVAVADAEAALVAHMQSRFDVLIVDWVLPGMDGLSLIRRIRELPEGDAPFIIAVTARNRPEDLARVLDAGADDFLPKPIDSGLLTARVRIAERRVARERRNVADREALARSQAEFRRVIEHCPLGVLAQEGPNIVYANGAMARILGVTRAELMGSKMSRFVGLEYRDVVERRANRFDRSGVPPPGIEATLLRDDGRELTARLIPVTRAWFEGREVSFVMIEDITARTAAERRLRMTQFAVDRSRDLILWVESSGHVTYANAAAGELLGYGSGELVGRRFHDIDAGAVAEGWNDWVANLAETGSTRFETRFIDRDGRPILVEVSANALLFDGETFVVVSARDLTERERLRENLLQAERLASVGSLAAGVAHEINNPLAYVIANLELMTEDLGAVVRQSEARDRLLELAYCSLDGADRVRRIVGDLRAFARQNDEQVGPVDVQRALEAAVVLADNHVRHRARLVRSYGAVEPVIAHEQRLVQVFVNLLINAAQAIPEGHSPEHTIVVRVESPSPAWVVASVSDTGGGIDPRLLDRIFEPFFTTKPQGEGTGLGLSICHGIISGFGGRIEVSSEQGRGSTFKVWLPVEDGTPVVRRHDSSPAKSVTPPSGVRVLVVDDEPLIAQTVSRALVGHRVTVAGSGREAVSLCMAQEFDVILCDIMMPDVSGMDVFRTVCEQRPELAERFAFMTGGAFTAQAREFIESFPHEPLAKPFSLRELREYIQRIAQGHGAADAEPGQ